MVLLAKSLLTALMLTASNISFASKVSTKTKLTGNIKIMLLVLGAAMSATAMADNRVPEVQGQTFETSCQERITRFVRMLAASDIGQTRLLRFIGELHKNPVLAAEFKGFDATHLAMVNFESRLAVEALNDLNLDECEQCRAMIRQAKESC